MEMSQECSFELHIFTIRTPKKLSAEGIQGRNVFVHPPLSYDETLEQQRMSDVLFLPLEFESPIPEIIRTSAPGKLGEYLASGVPVLAHVPANSFVADYLDKYQCGLVANENDPLSLKDCLLRLVNDGELSRTITNNARQRALLDFDPCVSGKRLTEFIFGD
jgi:glycosyltransferase involved in cell wall biosynthesis